MRVCYRTGSLRPPAAAGSVEASGPGRARGRADRVRVECLAFALVALPATAAGRAAVGAGRPLGQVAREFGVSERTAHPFRPPGNPASTRAPPPITAGPVGFQNLVVGADLRFTRRVRTR